MYMKLTEWLVWVPWHPHGSIAWFTCCHRRDIKLHSRPTRYCRFSIRLLVISKGCNTLKRRPKLKPLHAHWGIKEIKCLCFYRVCLCTCYVLLCTAMSLNTTESRKIQFFTLDSPHDDDLRKGKQQRLLPLCWCRMNAWRRKATVATRVALLSLLWNLSVTQNKRKQKLNPYTGRQRKN